MKSTRILLPFFGLLLMSSNTIAQTINQTRVCMKNPNIYLSDNTGDDPRIYNKFTSLTLTCNGKSLSININQSTNIPAPEMLGEEGKKASCIITGMRNGSTIQLASFTASYNCNPNKDDYGIIIISMPNYDTTPCQSNSSGCSFDNKIQGLSIYSGVELANTSNQIACLCNINNSN